MTVRVWHTSLERCAVGAAAACGFYLLSRLVNTRWNHSELQKQLLEAQAALEHEHVKRKAERVGRTRAEQELRAVKVQLQQLQLQLQELAHKLTSQTFLKPVAADASQPGLPASVGDPNSGSVNTSSETDAVTSPKAAIDRQEDGSAGAGGKDVAVRTGAAGDDAGDGGVVSGALEADRAAAAALAAALAAAGSALLVYPFRPIGHLRSVFSERNGTPRQPQLVPAARSRLVLSPNVPAACLEGLEQYSHCWVLYVFHANTDLAKYLSSDRTGLKAKIHVPRLNGGRMGVLATRSPHRPSPIGLSTAQIIRVEGNTLLLGGADIVDGSPVLDIKPYVPFCDCLAAARAPAWVQAEAADEPLAVGDVIIGPAALAALLAAWQARKTHSMYNSAEEYIQLVRQVLSRDIRSLHQRLNVQPTRTASGSTTNSSTAPTTTATQSHMPPPGAHSSSAQAMMAPNSSSATEAVTGSSGTPTGGNSTCGAASTHQGSGGDTAAALRQGRYHVVLENIYINYDIGPMGEVELRDAWVDPITAR